MSELAVIACLAFDLRAPADALAKFKVQLGHCPFVDSVMEVSGSYDLIVQCHFASLAQYTEQMELIRPQVAAIATRLDANFICNRTERRTAEDGEALWLPCEGGQKRVDLRLIDKVLAEGDYMRVHVGSWNCLLHDTMVHLSQQLAAPHFVKLRRSCLVRAGFIDRLLHEGRRWSARLKDGTHIPIAQSNVQRVLRLTHGESSTGLQGSSKNDQLTVLPAAAEENELKLPA